MNATSNANSHVARSSNRRSGRDDPKADEALGRVDLPGKLAGSGRTGDSILESPAGRPDPVHLCRRLRDSVDPAGRLALDGPPHEANGRTGDRSSLDDPARHLGERGCTSGVRVALIESEHVQGSAGHRLVPAGHRASTRTARGDRRAADRRGSGPRAGPLAAARRCLEPGSTDHSDHLLASSAHVDCRAA